MLTATVPKIENAEKPENKVPLIHTADVVGVKHFRHYKDAAYHIDLMRNRVCAFHIFENFLGVFVVEIALSGFMD